MKKWSFLVLFLLLLTGCRSTPFDGHTIIDWVDFIKWDGKEYNGIYSGALADEKFLGEKLGEVKFRVSDNVTNPSYKIKNGDAAFHEKGSEIFAIKGFPDLIAVRSDGAINGYRVYFSRDDGDYRWHFKDMPIEKVNGIELYQMQTDAGEKKIAELNNPDEVSRFLQLLKDSKENPNFQPNTEKGDPDYYEIVLYTDGPIAYKYNLQYDGHTYYWNPWDTNILADEIGAYFPKK